MAGDTFTQNSFNIFASFWPRQLGTSVVSVTVGDCRIATIAVGDRMLLEK